MVNQRGALFFLAHSWLVGLLLLSSHSWLSPHHSGGRLSNDRLPRNALSGSPLAYYWLQLVGAIVAEPWIALRGTQTYPEPPASVTAAGASLGGRRCLRHCLPPASAAIASAAAAAAGLGGCTASNITILIGLPESKPL